jgi:OmpA-OmpF porin, OOP family
MKLSVCLCTLTLIISISGFAQEDAPGCKDSPLFSRMANMVIGECSSNFNELEIPMAADKTDTKEGTKTTIQYNYNLEEATAPSFFQIVRNFENAIVKSGGRRIFYSKDAGVATLFGKSAGKDVWIVLRDFGGTRAGNFELNILEIEGMKQDIAAGEMLEALNKTGSVALYINFETGKSIITPESKTIVGEIVRMLKENPSLKISIEGHTDNVGSPQTNQTLSENRAKSVMTALVAEGIDKSRLLSKGWGQTKAISENNTEEGKAKNRRVEIVKL